MNKQAIYTFQGANQDVAQSKHPVQYYFEAGHIRLLSTDKASSGVVANEKGNTLISTIPDIQIDIAANIIEYGVYDIDTDSILNPTTINYTNGNEIDTQVADTILPSLSTSQVIIGHANTRDSIILFSTDNSGTDCIWELKGVLSSTYNLELIYIRNLGFSTSNPIQTIFNYENENIQKVYWVDGKHQIRSINITHNQIEGNDLLIDLPSNSLNFVGTIDFSQPIVSDVVGGGIHTSGMIQYAYNLYRLNSSQTKLSPLSELIPLDKGVNLGGGEVNEIVGSIPIVNISNIDLSYTHIKVYAIKYTSFNQIPSTDLIEEKELDGNSSITIYDDGSIISTLTLEELLFLGSNPTTPKHIETKDNRLFLANIETKDFIIPDELDMRAYSFPINSTTTAVYDNISLNGSGTVIGSSTTIDSTTGYVYSSKLDGINLDYINNKYQANNTVLGGEGKYLQFEIVQKSLVNPENYRVLKDREIYRFGIEFYNNLGQTSLPQWFADIQVPIGNLSGNYNTLKVTLKSEFYTWLNNYTFNSEDDKIVGYRVIRADRTLNDKTIICQGIVTGMMVNSIRDSQNSSLYNTTDKRKFSKIHPKLPNILARTFQTESPLRGNGHLDAMQFVGAGATATKNPLTEIQHDPTERKADTYQYTTMYQLFSPEILFSSVSLSNNLNFNVVGGLTNTTNSWWGQSRNIENKVVQIEGKTTNKIHPSASGATIVTINGNAFTDMPVGTKGVEVFEIAKETYMNLNLKEHGETNRKNANYWHSIKN